MEHSDDRTTVSPYPRALLDTSVVIDFDAAAAAAHADAVAVSVITMAELAYGLHTPDVMINANRQARYRWIASQFDVIDFDTECAEAYGALAASVRAAGRDPRPRRFDLLIAAVAVRHGLPLITRNAADFAALDSLVMVVSV